MKAIDAIHVAANENDKVRSLMFEVVEAFRVKKPHGGFYYAISGEVFYYYTDGKAIHTNKIRPTLGRFYISSGRAIVVR